MPSNIRLYIIGNGFDLHHGIKSSYSNFKAYLEGKDQDLVENLEAYFDADSLWSDFESTLEHLDTDKIVDECMDYLEPYSSDKWSDAYHHDYQYEVQKRIDVITSQLKERFTEWILQLSTSFDLEELVSLDKEGLYINFNYTNTLQRLYRIPDDQILHIHNKAIDQNSTLILGHSRNPQNSQSLAELNDEDTDVRVAEGNEILDKYFEDTYKSTGRIISENQRFFQNLTSIREIIVLGHSLSKVDEPYFAEIIRNVDARSVKWTISYYSAKAIENYQETMSRLGIDPDLIEYKKMNEIDSTQLSLF